MDTRPRPNAPEPDPIFLHTLDMLIMRSISPTPTRLRGATPTVFRTLLLALIPVATLAQLPTTPPTHRLQSSLPPDEKNADRLIPSDAMTGKRVTVPKNLNVELHRIQTESDPPRDAILIRGSKEDVDAAVKHFQALENAPDSQHSSANQDAFTSTQVRRLQSELATTNSRLEKLMKRYTPDHPTVRQAQAEKASAMAALARARHSFDVSNSVPNQSSSNSVESLAVESLRDLRIQHQEAERAAQLIASRLRSALQLNPPPPELQTLETQLRDAVRSAFEQRIKTQEAQLSSAESRLKATRENLQNRKRNADSIVEQRVAMLRKSTLSRPSTTSNQAMRPPAVEKGRPEDSRIYAIDGTQNPNKVDSKTPDQTAVRRLNELFQPILSVGMGKKGLFSGSEPSFLLQYATGSFLTSEDEGPTVRKVALSDASQASDFLALLPLCTSNEIEFVLSNGIRQIRRKTRYPMIPAQSAEEISLLQSYLDSIKANSKATQTEIEKLEKEYERRFGSSANARREGELIIVWHRQLADLRIEAITLAAQAQRLRSLADSENAVLLQEYEARNVTDPNHTYDAAENKRIVDAQRVLAERIKVVMGDDFRDHMDLAEATASNDEKHAMLISQMEAVDRSLAEAMAKQKMEHEIRDSLEPLYSQAKEQNKLIQFITSKLEQSPLRDSAITPIEDAIVPIEGSGSNGR